MRKSRKHENPSSHHMRGKENPKVHLTDHVHSGKPKGTRGKAVGNRAIKPAASSVRHPPLAAKTRSQLHKVHI